MSVSVAKSKLFTCYCVRVFSWCPSPSSLMWWWCPICTGTWWATCVQAWWEGLALCQEPIMVVTMLSLKRWVFWQFLVRRPLSPLFSTYEKNTWIMSVWYIVIQSFISSLPYFSASLRPQGIQGRVSRTGTLQTPLPCCWPAAWCWTTLSKLFQIKYFQYIPSCGFIWDIIFWLCFTSNLNNSPVCVQALWLCKFHPECSPHHHEWNQGMFFITSPQLSHYHIFNRPLLWDIGSEALMAGLVCFLEKITIHWHKAAFKKFKFKKHKAPIQIQNVAGHSFHSAKFEWNTVMCY